VIPELELIIGRQPPVPELPPAEAQSRFRIVFRHMVGAFAQKEHPLALFLDDLQWADPASLGLLRDLLTHPEMRYLFVVGAYRDNEVLAAHPLRLTLDDMRRAGARLSDIVLGPITHDWTRIQGWRAPSAGTGSASCKRASLRALMPPLSRRR
jgi:predicted ATPase